MSRPLAHVIPPEESPFFHRALGAAAVREAGWLFRGGRIKDGQIAAAFQHRSGKLARLWLAHPEAAPSPAARTERFAVIFPEAEASAAGRALLSAVVRSLSAVEAAFTWREASAPGSAEAAIVASHVLSDLHRHEEAFACLERALASATAPARLDVLARIFSLAAWLGFKNEALEALEALLQAAPGEPRFLAQAVHFYSARHDFAAAVPHAIALAAHDPARWLDAARCMAQAGLFAQASEAVGRAIGAGSTLGDLFSAAEILGEIGDFNGEREHLRRALAIDPQHLPSLVRLAQLCLWCGEHEEALCYAERCLAIDPAEPCAIRYRGAAALLRGDAPAALSDLEASAKLAPDHPETLALKGEALHLLGRQAEARAAIDRAQGRVGAGFTPLDLLRRRNDMSEGGRALTYQSLVENFIALLPVPSAALERLGLTLDPAHETAKETVERWSRLMAGNRSPVLTTFVKGRGLRRLYDGDGARTASRALQDLLQTRDPDEVLRRFDAVLEAFGDKTYPRCYRGEVLLWLGRYGEAREDFLAALKIRDDTRWAYVGLGAVELLSGRPEAALEMLELGIVRAKGPGPTTYAYRGEAYRLLGDLPKAIADLTCACGDWPSRAGARVNLALAHGAAGDSAAQDSAYRRLLDLLPGLLADAARAAGLASAMTSSAAVQRRLLEQARAMMRGNRSSVLGTWYDGAGRLRARLFLQEKP
jgi:tetratricopeptide (TPR) repeat protein